MPAFVNILRVYDEPREGEEFTRVEVDGLSDVGLLKAHLCDKHGLGTPFTLKLYRVPNETCARVIQDSPAAAAGILGGHALFTSDPVASGSWLLARIPPASAPATAIDALTAKLSRMEAQQAAVDPELLPMLQKGLFSILDADGSPICCGFFVSASGVALTVNHGRERWLWPGGVVRAAMLRANEGTGAGAAAAAAAAAAEEVLLEFKVHSYSAPDALDFTCMILTSAVQPGTFIPLQVPTAVMTTAQLIGAHATLLHGSIALNRFFNRDPSASLVSCSIFTAHPDRVLYTASTSGGDSGGALVLHGKALVAMRVEGLNDVSEDVEFVGPSAGKKRGKSMRLSEASPSTTGAALRLDVAEVQAAIAAAIAAAAASSAEGGEGTVVDSVK
jgi:hypothetical protein